MLRKTVHGEHYVMFVVEDFYNNVESRHYRCELHYSMVDAEDGAPLPSSTIYNGQDDLPFDVPLLWNKELSKYEVITPEQVEARRTHADPEQRFWMEKSWFMCGRSSMDQLQPQDLDSLSLGIALESDFAKTIREANLVRLENKAND